MLRGTGGVVLFVVATALPGRSAGADADDEEGVTQVEVAVAEGSGSGTFGCGQQTRVRYVRAAVQARHSERSQEDPRGQGVTVLVGATVEGGRETVVEPPEEDSDERPLGESWFDGRVGAQLRLGYRHRYFGVEGGGAFVVGTGQTPAALVFPNLEVSLGRRDLVYVLGGLGAAQLTTQLAYSAPYFGVGCLPVRGLEVEGFWAFQGEGWVPADRIDVIWRLRINERFKLRGGLAIGDLGGNSAVSMFAREASIGLVFQP